MKDSSLATGAIEQALNLTSITGGGSVYQEVGGVGYFVINSTSANNAQIKLLELFVAEMLFEWLIKRDCIRYSGRARR